MEHLPQAWGPLSRANTNAGQYRRVKAKDKHWSGEKEDDICAVIGVWVRNGKGWRIYAQKIRRRLPTKEEKKAGRNPPYVVAAVWQLWPLAQGQAPQELWSLQ
jgi:hypothetical protein